MLLASLGASFMHNIITASYKSNYINKLISLGQELSLAILLNNAYNAGVVTWLKLRSDCKILIRKAW